MCATVLPYNEFNKWRLTLLNAGGGGGGGMEN